MRKRELAFLLAAFALLLAACGVAGEPTDQEAPPPPAEEQTPPVIPPEEPDAVQELTALLQELRAEDLLWIDHAQVEARDLAAALNAADYGAAAYHRPPEGWHWDLTAALELGADGGFTYAYHEHLELKAGIAENQVEILYFDGEDYSACTYLTVEDRALYQMVRHSGDGEEVIDQEALEPFREMVEARMADALAEAQQYDLHFQKDGFPKAEYTACTLASFQLHQTSEDIIPGITLALYDVGWYLTAKHPENVVLAGGMYMDGDLHVRGYNDGLGQLLAQWRDGALIKGVFLPSDFFPNLESPEWLEEGGREELLRALGEESSGELLRLLSAVRAEDIQYIDYETVKAQDLAAALRGAAEHLTEKQSPYPDSSINSDLWSITAFLEGGPSFSWNEDANLSLHAGLTEDLVAISYRNGAQHGRVAVEDEALYWLVRRAYDDPDAAVDRDALEQFREPLEARMAEKLESFRACAPEDRAGYSGYEVVNLQQIRSYDDLVDGVTVELYDFHYALTMEHPEHMFWVGGNFIDSELRMQDFDIDPYFAAYWEGGKLVHTCFLAYDLFCAPDDTAAESQAREVLADQFANQQ